MNTRKDTSERNSDPPKPAVIRPQEVATPQDVGLYIRQRLGANAPPSFPTVRVPSPSLWGVMPLVLKLMDSDDAAFEDLWGFELPGGDTLFTTHFDTATAGDAAAAFFLEHAVTDVQKTFAVGYQNTVRRLHALHAEWVALGRPLCP